MENNILVRERRCPAPSTHVPHTPLDCSSQQCGQATVEFVGTLPILVLGALLIVQALLLALATIFAQSSAPTAARMLAAGTRSAQVQRQLPIAPSFRHGASVQTHAGRVRVRLFVPRVLPLVDRSLLQVAASSPELPT